MAMTMRRKKPAAKLPKPRPDLFPIRLRNFNSGKRLTGKKLKAPFAMSRRQRFELLFDLKQKHEPMALSKVPVLAHDSRQMQIRRRQFHAQFLLRLATGAGIRRLADIRVQLPAARTPKAQVRLLRALEQQHFIPLIEAIEQRGDFVRQRHTVFSSRLNGGGELFASALRKMA